MQRYLTALMTVSGAVLGIFIAFSREPVAGAVIGGVLTTVTAIGLFFLSAKEHKENEQTLIKAAATSMLWFYGSLVVATGIFLGVSLIPGMPTNLDLERNVLKAFLSSSGMKAIEVSGQKYQIDQQVTEAATALILSGKDLSSQATGIRVFSTSQTPDHPNVGINVGGAYCVNLNKMIASNGSDLSSLAKFDGFTNNAEAKLAGKLLQAVDQNHAVDLGKLVADAYCNPQGTP